MKKISNVFLTVFAVGVLATLFAGALSFVGYVVALCMGGEGATQLCVFIHKECFPWIIRISSVSVGFGLIGMYLSKRKALTMSDSKESESK